MKGILPEQLVGEMLVADDRRHIYQATALLCWSGIMATLYALHMGAAMIKCREGANHMLMCVYFLYTQHMGICARAHESLFTNTFFGSDGLASTSAGRGGGADLGFFFEL